MFGWIFSEFNIRKRHFLFSSNDIVRYGGKVNSQNSSIILEVGVRNGKEKTCCWAKSAIHIALYANSIVYSANDRYSRS